MLLVRLFISKFATMVLITSRWFYSYSSQWLD